MLVNCCRKLQLELTTFMTTQSLTNPMPVGRPINWSEQAAAKRQHIDELLGIVEVLPPTSGPTAATAATAATGGHTQVQIKTVQNSWVGA